MRVAIVSGGRGWHVRDLERALAELGRQSVCVPLQTLSAGAGAARAGFPDVEAAIVRSIPAGTLEQTVLRMNLLHRLEAEGLRIFNPPGTVETCVDKWLTAA